MLRQRNMWAIGRIRWVANSGGARMLKLGKGLSPFRFPPIPRDVAMSEAGSCAFVIDLNYAVLMVLVLILTMLY